MKAGLLADGDARVLVERGLALQGKSGAAWAWEWGDFLEAAWGKGLMSDEQKATYAKNGVRFQFVMRNPARQGEKCGVSLEVSMQRVGNTMGFFVSPTLKELKIGGEAIEVGTLNAQIGLMGAGGTGTVSEEIVLDVEPGEQAASISDRSTSASDAQTGMP